MNENFDNPVQDADSPKVYVGAYVPLEHFHRLVEEAEQAKVSQSEVIRWALAERYGEQGKAQPWSGGKE